MPPKELLLGIKWRIERENDKVLVRENCGYVYVRAWLS